jgi:hypothetical protein
MLSQFDRVTFASYDIPNNVHPGLSSDIADYVGQLNIPDSDGFCGLQGHEFSLDISVSMR